MTPGRRVGVWRVVVVATLASNVIYAASGAAAAEIVSTASLVAMLALLLTTPVDAIVLPRRTSERMIAIGFWIPATIAARVDAGRGALAAATLLAGIGLLALCRWRSASAWWTAAILWQPIVLACIKNS